MSTPTKLIVKLDASSLKTSACMRKFYLTCIEGYRSKGNKNSIEYGSAFHIFREQYSLSNGNLGTSLGAAQDYYKQAEPIVSSKQAWLDINHLTQSCIEYARQIDDKTSELNKFVSLKGQDGLPLVEKTFAIPYRIEEDIEVLLCGTIDDMGTIVGGCYDIDDFKTTSAWDERAYFRQYLLNNQLMMYKLAVTLQAGLYPDSIFNTMLSKGELGCSITAAFLKPTEPRVKFKRQVFFYKKDTMNEFVDMLNGFIDELIKYIRYCKDLKKLPYRYGLLNGTCKGVYGEGDECMYYGACSAPEAAFSSIMKNTFVQREYNPLMFRKKSCNNEPNKVESAS